MISAHTSLVWNRNTLQLTHDFPFHTGPVNCLSVRPDGELFVSASGDGTIMLWDLNKCTLIKKLYQGTPGLACIAFTVSTASSYSACAHLSLEGRWLDLLWRL
jgi:WD40 repeat protein